MSLLPMGLHQQGREVAEGCCKDLDSVALGLLLNKESPVILARAAGSAQKPGKLNDIIWVLPTDNISTQTPSAWVSAEKCGQAALVALWNPLKPPFLSAKDPGKQLTLILVSTFTWGILVQILCAPGGTPAASQPSKPALSQCHIAETSPTAIPSAPFPLWGALATAVEATHPVAGGIYHTWQQVWGCYSRRGGHMWQFFDLLQSCSKTICSSALSAPTAMEGRVPL